MSVLLLAIGYQREDIAPVFSSGSPVTNQVVDPLVQPMTLTDVVVSAAVTVLLLALATQIERTHRTLDPESRRA